MYRKKKNKKSLDFKSKKQRPAYFAGQVFASAFKDWLIQLRELLLNHLRYSYGSSSSSSSYNRQQQAFDQNLRA